MKIQSSFKIINKALRNKGYSKKNMYTIVSGTNVGKTTFLLQETLKFISCGAKVLFISNEISKETIVNKLLNVYRKKRKVDNFFPFADLEILYGKCKKKLVIVDNIKNKVDYVNIIKEIKPDVVVIDYPNSFLSGKLDTLNTIQLKHHLNIFFKEHCYINNYSLLITEQLNRDVSFDNVGPIYSQSISAMSDGIILLNNKNKHLEILKNRDGHLISVPAKFFEGNSTIIEELNSLPNMPTIPKMPPKK